MNDIVQYYFLIGSAVLISSINLSGNDREAVLWCFFSFWWKFWSLCFLACLIWLDFVFVICWYCDFRKSSFRSPSFVLHMSKATMMMQFSMVASTSVIYSCIILFHVELRWIPKSTFWYCRTEKEFGVTCSDATKQVQYSTGKRLHHYCGVCPLGRCLDSYDRNI